MRDHATGQTQPAPQLYGRTDRNIERDQTPTMRCVDRQPDNIIIYHVYRHILRTNAVCMRNKRLVIYGKRTREDTRTKRNEKKNEMKSVGKREERTKQE